jgi:hypothetical protein
LFSKSNVVIGKGGILSLGLMPGRIETAKEFAGEIVFKLVSAVQVQAVIETFGIITRILCVDGIAIKENEIGPECQFCSGIDFSEKVKASILLSAYILPPVTYTFLYAVSPTCST